MSEMCDGDEDELALGILSGKDDAGDRLLAL